MTKNDFSYKNILGYVFQKMTAFHTGLEEINSHLNDLEKEKARWPPVGDVMLDALQDEIETCRVSFLSITIPHMK